MLGGFDTNVAICVIKPKILYVMNTSFTMIASDVCHAVITLWPHCIRKTVATAPLCEWTFTGVAIVAAIAASACMNKSICYNVIQLIMALLPQLLLHRVNRPIIIISRHQ